jgi:hypothetical protein
MLAAAAVPGNAQQKSASKAEQSCRKYVQSFYDWYVPRIMKSADTYDLVLNGKAPSAFSPSLLRQLRADFAAAKANPNEVVGLDFDPFLNSQDPSETFKVTRVRAAGDKCTAEVHGITDGVNNEEVHPKLMMVNGGWQFVNFRYEQNSDLLSMLKSLKADRQKAAGR